MNDDFLKQISRELKVVRIEHDLSIQELSEKTGISTATICNYENNKTFLYMNKILEMLSAYEDITPIIFFNRITTKM